MIGKIFFFNLYSMVKIFDTVGTRSQENCGSLLLIKLKPKKYNGLLDFLLES